MNNFTAPRAADPDRVRTRPFEASAEQSQLIEWLFDGLKLTCQTPEDAIAVIVYALSEFILRGAKANSIPEAVATAIECLKLNTDRCLTSAELVAQAKRCACRGSNDLCQCQNVQDEITTNERTRSKA